MAHSILDRILVSAAVAVIYISPAQASWPGPEEAQAALDSRDWTAEFSLCDDDRTCADVLEERATLYFSTGAHARAVEDLTKALALDSSPDRHLRIGLSLVPLGRDREAEAHLTVGLVLPGADPALADRARILLGVLGLDASKQPIETGQVFPNLALLDAQGDRTLAQTPGPLVVDLWSVTCAPCIAAMPRLQRESQAWSKAGITLIGINVDRRKEQYERFLRKRPLAYDTGWGGPVAMEQTGTVALPTVYILDEQHRVFAMFSGDFGPEDSRVDTAVNAWIESKAKATSTIGEVEGSGRDENGE